MLLVLNKHIIQRTKITQIIYASHRFKTSLKFRKFRSKPDRVSPLSPQSQSNAEFQLESELNESKLNETASESKIEPGMEQTIDDTTTTNKNRIQQKMSNDSTSKIEELMILPVIRKPVFPGVTASIFVNNPATIAHIRENQFLATFLRRDTPEGYFPQEADILTDVKDIYETGTLVSAQINSQNNFQVNVSGQTRVQLRAIKTYGPPTIAEVEFMPFPPLKQIGPPQNDLTREISDRLETLFKLNPNLQYTFLSSVRFQVANSYGLSCICSCLASLTSDQLQDICDEPEQLQRLQKTLNALDNELKLYDIQAGFTKKILMDNLQDKQKFFLQENYRRTLKELGAEKDDKDSLILHYQDLLTQTEKNIPQNILHVIKEQIERLVSIEKTSPEFFLTKNYLDWLMQIPYGKFTNDNFDLIRAKKILDEDHFGLNDVKDQILQFIAVSKLKRTVQGKILCFVGPPGVGKTSIAKSIARALERQFYSFSVGGLSDPSEIRGHRRTYVGAMPGKFVTALKQTGTLNPLILIDEIDKITKGYKGDPSSAFLEIFDPNQNNAFFDHYLDVSVDLSKVLFVCTANTLDTISEPLIDRMEIIRLSGYDIKEKLEIAQKYLVPKVLEKSGFQLTSLPTINTQALEDLIRWYCREPGVRNLEKHIEKIARKLAVKTIEETENKNRELSEIESQWEITPENLKDFVGQPRFDSDTLYEGRTPPGIVLALAWNSFGGATFYIETSKVHSTYSQKKIISDSEGNNINEETHETPFHGATGRLSITGQLGSVMQESSKIAFIYAKNKLAQVDPNNTFFTINDIHVHMPKGATPKDGPSAGITLVTALLSLAMNKSVKDNLAMTGEISLTGKVLPIGGLKEKVLAGRQANVKHIIVPRANQRDVDELPSYLKEGIQFYYADSYNDVFKIAFEVDDSNQVTSEQN